jgi:hypothetical protein
MVFVVDEVDDGDEGSVSSTRKRWVDGPTKEVLHKEPHKEDLTNDNADVSPFYKPDPEFSFFLTTCKTIGSVK